MWFVVLGALLAALVVYVNGSLVRTSSIANIDELRYELTGLNPSGAQQGWEDLWLWPGQAPHQYRVLGRVSVWTASRALEYSGLDRDSAFYWSFVFCCFLFLACTLTSVGVFTAALSRDVSGTLPRDQGFGIGVGAVLLFALCPPILFFSKYPVHGTPNDLLGYFLMVLGLYLILREKIAAFSVVAALAALSRETTLLIPFIFIFFSSVPLWKRAAAVLPSLLIFVAMRALWPGSYDPLQGSRINFMFPLETLVFTMLVFGPLWTFGTLGYFHVRKSGGGNFARHFNASLPYAVALTFAVVLALARMREIRIAYVLSVFFVPYAAMWIHAHRYRIAGLIRTKRFWVAFLAAVVVTFRVWVWMMPSTPESYAWLATHLGVVFTGYLATPQYNWIAISCVYLFLLIVSFSCLAVEDKKKAAQAPPFSTGKPLSR